MDFYNADETADQEDEDKFAAVGLLTGVPSPRYVFIKGTPSLYKHSLIVQGFEPFKENLVFLIDAQPAMFEETNLVDSPVGCKSCRVVLLLWSASSILVSYTTGLQQCLLV